MLGSPRDFTLDALRLLRSCATTRRVLVVFGHERSRAALVAVARVQDPDPLVIWRFGDKPLLPATLPAVVYECESCEVRSTDTSCWCCGGEVVPAVALLPPRGLRIPAAG